MPTSMDDARAAKEALQRELEGMPGLTGIGIALDGKDHVVRVNVRNERDRGKVPEVCLGVRVVVVVTGEVRKR